jgi:hypothetical protein
MEDADTFIAPFVLSSGVTDEKEPELVADNFLVPVPSFPSTGEFGREGMGSIAPVHPSKAAWSLVLVLMLAIL